jgi:hypothetical protein
MWLGSLIPWYRHTDGVMDGRKYSPPTLRSRQTVSGCRHVRTALCLLSGRASTGQSACHQRRRGAGVHAQPFFSREKCSTSSSVGFFPWGNYKRIFSRSPKAFSKPRRIECLGTCFVCAAFGVRRSPVASPKRLPK